jgi:hypothetical protein
MRRRAVSDLTAYFDADFLADLGLLVDELELVAEVGAPSGKLFQSFAVEEEWAQAFADGRFPALALDPTEPLPFTVRHSALFTDGFLIEGLGAQRIEVHGDTHQPAEGEVFFSAFGTSTAAFEVDGRPWLVGSVRGRAVICTVGGGAGLSEERPQAATLEGAEAVFAGWVMQDWLTERHEEGVGSASPAARLLSVAVAARHWREEPGALAARLVALTQPDADVEPVPSASGVAARWLRSQDDEAVEGAHAELGFRIDRLCEELEGLCDQLERGGEGTEADAPWIALERDDLESARLLLAQAGQVDHAESLAAQLADVDYISQIRGAAFERLSPLSHPQLTSAGEDWRTEGRWWVVLGGRS